MRSKNASASWRQEHSGDEATASRRNLYFFSVFLLSLLSGFGLLSFFASDFPPESLAADSLEEDWLSEESEEEDDDPDADFLG
jgi:hypothetical protein